MRPRKNVPCLRSPEVSRMMRVADSSACWRILAVVLQAESYKRGESPGWGAAQPAIQR
jgi:hypothetical protein